MCVGSSSGTEIGDELGIEAYSPREGSQLLPGLRQGTGLNGEELVEMWFDHSISNNETQSQAKQKHTLQA